MRSVAWLCALALLWTGCEEMTGGGVDAAGDGGPVLKSGNDMEHPPAGDDHGDGGMPGHLGDGGTRPPDAGPLPPDGGAPPPDAGPPPTDGGPVPSDAGLPADGGTRPPMDAGQGADMGPPSPSGHITIYGAGASFRDVSTDESGAIWAVTDQAVYYFAGGHEFHYDQKSGLTQGKTTWTDTYWFGTKPSTQPVTFTSVAGGLPGQAVIANVGYIADRLDVDPQTGAVRDVVGLQVTATQQPDPTELEAQKVREVATWKVALDLNGTFHGTAYLGGWHGTSCLHGLTQPRTSGLCGTGCYDYQEHVHPFSAGDVLGGDVHGLAITALGDLWMGDRKALYFMPQRSLGPEADFFQTIAIPGQPQASYLDVFPGVDDDWIYGVAVDATGGLYIASYGQGLAYLAPGTYAPTYWTMANGLPQNQLTGVAIDDQGDVWVATQSAGAARYTPSTHSWAYFTTASGLPTNELRAVYVDPYHQPGAVYFATTAGVTVYTR